MVRPRAAVCGPCRHRIHVLLALVGRHLYLVLDIIISLFLALAVEPLVVALVAHGWKRGVASAVSLVGVAVVVGVLLTLFGNMFVQQMIAMVRGLPAMYEQIREFVDQYATFKMPEISNLGMEIFNNIQTSWVTDFAGTAMSTVGGLFSFLLNLMTVVMTTYYISAAGPKLRRSFCQWLAPTRSADSCWCGPWPKARFRPSCSPVRFWR